MKTTVVLSSFCPQAHMQNYTALTGEGTKATASVIYAVWEKLPIT